MIFANRFLDLIKDEIRQAQGNEEFYFGNPVNAYLFIKHLTVDWYAIEELLPKGTTKLSIFSFFIKNLFLDFSKSFSDKWLFPSFEDFTGIDSINYCFSINIYLLGSAIGLMRLQDTYKLNTSQLANGEISSKYKSKRLTG